MSSSSALATLPELGALPDKVITIVAENLEPDDMSSFRLVSRRLRLNCTTPFAKEFFTKLRVFMARISLETLFSICCHHEFGHYVQEIAFASQRLLPDGLKRMDDAFDEIPFLSPDSRKQKLSSIQQFYRSYSMVHAEQVAIHESGEAMDMLTRALDALSDKGHGVRLAICDTVQGSSTRILGRRRFDKTYPPRELYDTWIAIRALTFELVFGAASRSSCPIDTIDINIEGHYLFDRSDLGDKHDAAAIANNEYFCDKPQPVLGHLTRLGVFFSSTTVTAYNIEALETIMSAARRLKVLHISNDRSPPGNIDDAANDFRAISMAFRSEHLDDLAIKRCLAREKDVVDVLKRHHKSLQFLELSRVRLQGSWASLLDCIAVNLNLETIVLKQLESVELDGSYVVRHEGPSDFRSGRAVSLGNELLKLASLLLSEE